MASLPLNVIASLSLQVSYTQALSVYQEMMDGLRTAGFQTFTHMRITKATKGSECCGKNIKG